MGKVKSSPLVRCQGPQDGMVCNWLIAPEARLAICDGLFHPGQILQNFDLHLLWRHAAGKSSLRRLPPSRHPVQLCNYEALQSLAAAVGTSQGLPGSNTTFQVFSSPNICEVQMLENLRSAPFAFRLAGEIVRRHSMNRVRYPTAQLRQVVVHCDLVECDGRIMVANNFS